MYHGCGICKKKVHTVAYSIQYACFHDSCRRYVFSFIFCSNINTNTRRYDGKLKCNANIKRLIECMIGFFFI